MARPVDTSKGHPYIGMLVGWMQEIDLDEYLESNPGKTVRDFKTNHLPWFSPGIFRTGSRMIKENCVGVSILGFDFDDARFSNRELEEVFRGVEHLWYTTITHDPKKPYRKMRVVVPISRPVSLSEHERIMAYYQLQFDLLGKGSIDEATLTAERKFYMPHAQCDWDWVKKRKHPLNVDRLLLKIPKLPIVQPPRWEDMVPVVDGKIQEDQRDYTGIYAKMQRLIDEMAPRNRSHKACQVGGLLKHIPRSEHEEWFQKMRARGVDQGALRSARQYAEKA